MKDELTYEIIGCVYKVHSTLGPGLYESTYEICLAHELNQAGLKAECQKSIGIHYKDLFIERAYRADILVNEQVIVEVKSVSDMHSVHLSQLSTYLKLSGLRTGILLNFNVKNMREGIRRINVKPNK